MTTAQDTANTRTNAIRWLDAQIAIFALAIDKLEAAKRAILVVTNATPELEESLPPTNGTVKSLMERLTA